MASQDTYLEITTSLPEPISMNQVTDATTTAVATPKKRNRPRVSLDKWVLFQNDSFPELYYRSIKAIIKDRKTHHLKMSQIMKMLETPDIMTPLGKIRKRSRTERLIWFPKKSTTSFEAKEKTKRKRKSNTVDSLTTESSATSTTTVESTSIVV